MSKSWFTKGHVGYADTTGSILHFDQAGRAHRVGQAPPPVPGAMPPPVPGAAPPKAPQPAPQPAPPAAAPSPDVIIALTDMLNRGPYPHEATMALVRQNLGDPAGRGWRAHIQAIFGPLVNSVEGAGNQAGAQRLRNMADDLANAIGTADTNASALPILYRELNVSALGVDFFAQNPKGDPAQLQQIMAQQQQAAQQKAPQDQQQAPFIGPLPPPPRPPTPFIGPLQPPPRPPTPFIGPTLPTPAAEAPPEQPGFVVQTPGAQQAFQDDAQQPTLQDRQLLQGLADQLQPQGFDFGQFQQPQQQIQQDQQRAARRRRGVVIAVVVGLLITGGAVVYFARKH